MAPLSKPPPSSIRSQIYDTLEFSSSFQQSDLKKNHHYCLPAMDLVPVPDRKRRRKLVKLAHKNNINSKLPSHIIQKILSKLLPVDLFPCRLVSKAWHTMVFECYLAGKVGPNSFHFSHLFGTHPSLSRPSRTLSDLYSIDFDFKYADGIMLLARYHLPSSDWSNFLALNSCNGLLSIMKRHPTPDSLTYSSCCILNPITNQFMDLPVPAPDSDRLYDYAYGLGCSLKTKRFKVIRIGIPRGDYIHTKIQICTLGYDKKWRGINFIPYTFNHLRKHPGVFLDGALHWIANDGDSTKNICRIDLESESFEALPLPSIDSINNYLVDIQAFNGHLYATLRDCRKHLHEWEIWKMQKPTRVKDSWIKEFVHVNQLSNGCEWWKKLQLIKVGKDGEILYLIHALFSYNPKNGRVKTLNNDKRLQWSWVQEIEHPNFNSLNKILAGDGSIVVHKDHVGSFHPSNFYE